MAETLSFPIEVPGAEEAKRDLGAIADAFERVGVEADSVGRSQAQLGESLGGLRGALTDVKDRGLEELSQKAGELGQRLGGVSGQIANVAIKSAAAFGGIGIAVTAVGAALAFAVQAWQEYSARVELANARSEELTQSVETLGASYPSMRDAVEGATTAVEAHTRALAENQRILGQQLELMNRGFGVEQARAYTVQLQQVSGAVRELGTFLHGASAEQIQQTLESGNATAQQELLGLSFQHSTDAATENANRLAAVAVLQHRAAEATAAHKDQLVVQAQAALASARADAAVAAELDDNGTAAASAARRVQEATDALTEAQNRAAEAHRNAAAGATEARDALDRLETASRATAEQEQRAALARGYATITRLAHEQEQRRAAERHASVRHEATATRELKNEKTALLEFERQLADAYAQERAAVAALAAAERQEQEARDAAARSAVDALIERQRATEEAQKENLRPREERAKAETPEAARQARENDLVRRRQEERLAATETYQERLRGLYQHEMDMTSTLAESSQTAFAAMGEAFAKHVESMVDGSESVGEALRGYLADVLAAISKEAFVKSAFYFAQGIGQLAGVVTAPLAPASFAASAGFAAVGALAGVGSAAVRPSVPSAATPSGLGGGGGERAASLSKGGAGESTGAVYNINFGGPMYGTGGVRQAARQMVGAINRGGIQGGVQLLPGVLQGAGAGA